MSEMYVQQLQATMNSQLRLYGSQSTGNQLPFVEESLKVSRVGIHKFLKKYRETGSIDRKAGSGRPTKRMTAVKELVERQMQKDDKTIVVQLYALLAWNGHHMTLKTVLRCRPTISESFYLFSPLYFSLLCNTIVPFKWVFLLYNGAKRSVLPAFGINKTLTIYCHIPYVVIRKTWLD